MTEWTDGQYQDKPLWFFFCRLKLITVDTIHDSGDQITYLTHSSTSKIGFNLENNYIQVRLQ